MFSNRRPTQLSPFFTIRCKETDGLSPGAKDSGRRSATLRKRGLSSFTKIQLHPSSRSSFTKRLNQFTLAALKVINSVNATWHSSSA